MLMNTTMTATTELTALDRFDGEFSFLPFEAGVRYGEVPLYPTGEDFQNAACVCAHEQRPAAVWFREAIRWRRGPGYGRPLNEGLKAIASATATAIYSIQHGGR